MSLEIDEKGVRLYVGNVLDELDELEPASVDVIVTSPPYWSLRDYGTEPQDYGDWTGQLGLEPTVDMYVRHVVDVFERCRRVLKDSGSLWVNIGDTYNGYKRGNTDDKHVDMVSDQHFTKRRQKGIPNRSLCMVPSRFAIAMTDKGWILHNEVIWHKPNAMPQSCRTRFNVDFEKILWFSKTPRYHFDQLKEPSVSHPGEERIMRTTWSIPTVASGAEHVAKYPPVLVERPVKSCCPEGGLVLDPFAGAGSTLVYCAEHGYRAVGIELDPRCAEVVRDRLRHCQGE